MNNQDQILDIAQQIIDSPLVSSQSLGGGSNAITQKLLFENGKSCVIKFAHHPTDAFVKEGNGLKELAKSNCFNIPKVIFSNDQCLITEYMEPGSRNQNAMWNFGVNLARMHRYTSNRPGFYENNYLGDAIQINVSNDSNLTWSDFFWTYRLEYQVNWGNEHRRFSSDFLNNFKEFHSVYDELIKSSDNTPRLLHGDLWSGNYIFDPTGEATIIDPAVYYGHREADLAMTKLFGGFSPEFYSGYQNEFPLDEGWQEREDIYILYHVLNHYNLFGGGYLRQAQNIIEHYLRK